MKFRRLLGMFAIAGFLVGASGAPASAAPKKCPPGQTAVVTVIGTEVVTTCRVL